MARPCDGQCLFDVGGRGHGECPVAQHGDQFVQVRKPCGDVGESWVVAQVGPPDGGGELVERAPLGRVATDDDRLAVARREHRVVAGPEAADPRRVDRAFPQVVVHVLVHVQHRLRHRDVDVVAAAGAPTLHQRSQDAAGALERGVHVGIAVRIVAVGGDALGAQSCVTLCLGEPGLGPDDRRVRTAVHPRPGLPVPTDRCVDEARTASADRRVVEPHPTHDARPEVLDQHIATVGERQQQLACLGMRHVEADVALARVLLHEVARQAVDARVGEPGHVAVGRLDLDDLGPEVAQHPRAMGATEHAGEIEHAHAGERAGPVIGRVTGRSTGAIVGHVPHRTRSVVPGRLRAARRTASRAASRAPVERSVDPSVESRQAFPQRQAGAGVHHAGGGHRLASTVLVACGRERQRVGPPHRAQ